MLKITNMSKIYVLCPYKTKTGGTELLHQLVHELNKNNHDAHIVYVGVPNNQVGDITTGFECYISNSVSFNTINNSKENILVVPEVFTFDIIDKFNNMQKVIWWLSVDNFVKNNGFINHLKFWGFAKTLSHTIKRLYKLNSIKEISSLGDIHLCQSHYAIDFLIKSGVAKEKIEYLSDYINEVYLEKEHSINNREDVVLYNPKKGYKFTEKLIKAAPDLKWVPLINLTTSQVQELVAKSKVYIDFGNHPGKDRFPREAAISGCCIITGKNGSASYYEDVMIDDQFKFDCNEDNISAIVDKVRSCINNYNEYSGYFDRYREMIRNEKNIFSKDVTKIFKARI